MDGYFISFLVTHLINFLLSLRRLLRITIKSIALHTTLLSVAAMGFGIFAASFVSNVCFRFVSFLLILGALLFLLGILRKDDILWAKGLLYKK